MLSVCKAGILGYSMASNTGTWEAFLDLFWFSSTTIHMQKSSRTNSRETEAWISTQAHSRLYRSSLIAFLWSIQVKYLQIVYDINPLVLAILEVYLDSHREFSPASPGQVERRFPANNDSHDACTEGSASKSLFLRKPKTAWLIDS